MGLMNILCYQLFGITNKASIIPVGTKDHQSINIQRVFYHFCWFVLINLLHRCTVLEIKFYFRLVYSGNIFSNNIQNGA